MKKRAFVRYSKQGKIVPGSLIITNGSFPSGPSTWDEIPADLCCETTPTTTAAPFVCNGYFNDSGDSIVGLSYTLCDGTIVEDGSFDSGQSICVQVGTLSGPDIENFNAGPCGV